MVDVDAPERPQNKATARRRGSSRATQRPPRSKLTLSTETALVLVSEKVASKRDQERFKQFIEQAQAIQNQIDTLNQLVDRHRIAFNQAIKPLEKRQDEIKRNMVIWLSQRASQGKLSPKVQRMIKQVICDMAIDYALEGDSKMRDIYDLHSDTPLADLERVQMEEAQAFYEEMMKEQDSEDGLDESLEDSIQARFDQLHKKAQDKAKADYEKNKTKQHAQEALHNQQVLNQAGHALRHLYRQLARQLHPDREPDPDARATKTHLMSQVNIAYAQQDVVALMRLQAQCEQTHELDLNQVGSQSIEGLIELVQIRIKHLTRAYRDVQLHAVAEFVLPSSKALTEARLNQHLESIKLRHQIRIRDLKSEFVQIQNDPGLSEWLREQALLM